MAEPIVDTRRIYTANIIRDNSITDRCLRKWIASNRFPPPDGNLNGRNFWLESTYARWQADVLAGRYSQHRRPGVQAAAA
jgi:hypothetical protein